MGFPNLSDKRQELDGSKVPPAPAKPVPPPPKTMKQQSQEIQKAGAAVAPADPQVPGQDPAAPPVSDATPVVMPVAKSDLDLQIDPHVILDTTPEQQQQKPPGEAQDMNVAQKPGEGLAVPKGLNMDNEEAVRDEKPNPAVVAKMGAGSSRLSSYRGVDYEIESKGRAPSAMYRGVCEDLGIKTGWKDSATSAGQEIRKMIDESISDRDG